MSSKLSLCTCNGLKQRTSPQINVFSMFPRSTTIHANTISKLKIWNRKSKNRKSKIKPDPPRQWYMGMFVQSFWFGARLVRDGKIGAGDVVAVLLGMFDHNEQFTDVNSSLDLAKGKFTIVALLTLILDLQCPSPPTRLQHQALPLLPPAPWSPSAESPPNLPWQVPYRLCRSAPHLTLPPCSRTHFRRQLFWLRQIHHCTDPTQSILCR